MTQPKSTDQRALVALLYQSNKCSDLYREFAREAERNQDDELARLFMDEAIRLVEVSDRAQEFLSARMTSRASGDIPEQAQEETMAHIQNLESQNVGSQSLTKGN